MSSQNNVIRKSAQHTYPKKRVLCLVSNAAPLHGMEVGFFAEEMTRPFFDFIHAGYDVDVASPQGGKVVFDGHSNPENPEGAYPNDLISIGFVHHKEFGRWMQNTIAISDVNVNDYDAVCVAGGGAPLITFKDDTKLHQLIADFYEAGKVTCLICHGTSLLLWTRLNNGELLADGKTWTGFADSEEDMINEMFGMTVNDYTIETEARKNPNTNFEVAGALEPFAVRDGLLITAQQQHSSFLASQLVIEALSE
ncbi:MULTISPECIES: type 1 glutamine amidotransferase domain-containing protein [Empedobacter]|uniref:type 1 glutamine amidotransferase domain-containing protein n=1 Tax=Empedobacter TaxID=59734 RepID=UPI001C5929CC|nr:MULTISPECIES: type 1 glutamine amidotransferase domain-containing protein [Empedobacter]MBW1619813.1 type 1 glutamine amidotransferase domain-containing protein [Empedobacter falsenii]MDM1040182.1 type 1 glutamine amidotransferase domain-containing protein [Empedobacter brevis]MDM1134114.1 type 1 glutamine amidotransferase domain-containing protein [Empedobacter sp. R750]